MKTKILSLSLLAAVALAQADDKKGLADPNAEPPTTNRQVPPPVSTAPPRPVSGETFVYEQKPITGVPVLIPPDQAQAIIARFRAAYPKLGSPRILIFVNRELVDDRSGVKLVGRTETTVAARSEINKDLQADPNAPKDAKPTATTRINAGGNVTIAGDVITASDVDTPGKGKVTAQGDRQVNTNTYRVAERPVTSVQDKQLARDIERLFGRPLRMGGAALADQRVATQLIGDKPLQQFTVPTEGEQARKDREALGKIADIVLEVLISTRPMVIREVSGDKTYDVADIHATAIRLGDSRVIGQADAHDIIGKRGRANWVTRNFDIRDIAEATALALMDDMTLGVNP